MSDYARSLDEEALAVVLQGHATAHGVPGAALGILRRGDSVAAYCGVEDVRTASPVTPSTRFGIGLLTKSMVASALAVLDAERQLSLDDPVAAHVPELRRCRWAKAGTLRALMANWSPHPTLCRRVPFPFPVWGFAYHPSRPVTRRSAVPETCGSQIRSQSDALRRLCLEAWQTLRPFLTLCGLSFLAVRGPPALQCKAADPEFITHEPTLKDGSSRPNPRTTGLADAARLAGRRGPSGSFRVWTPGL
jgi:hypothetical protein